MEVTHSRIPKKSRDPINGLPTFLCSIAFIAWAWVGREYKKWKKKLAYLHTSPDQRVTSEKVDLWAPVKMCERCLSVWADKNAASKFPDGIISIYLVKVFLHQKVNILQICIVMESFGKESPSSLRLWLVGKIPFFAICILLNQVWNLKSNKVRRVYIDEKVLKGS